MRMVVRRLLKATQLGLFETHVRPHIRAGHVVRGHQRKVERSLHEEYGDRGAPVVGQKGYVPEGYDGRGRAAAAATMVDLAAGLIEDPDFAMMLQVHPDDDDAMWNQEDAADMIGVPGTNHRGGPFGLEERLELLRVAVHLALAQHPERWWGTGLDHDGGAVPAWVARALMQDALQPGRLRLVNVSKEQAGDFIERTHSQLPYLNPRGLMYAIGAVQDGRLVAVATAGAPTGRWADPHGVLEITRVASDGSVMGASSKLVARLLDLLPTSVREEDSTAKLVTYQLAGESGTIYKALASKGLRPVAFIPGKTAGGRGSRGDGTQALAGVDKIRWEAGPGAGPADWSLLERLHE